MAEVTRDQVEKWVAVKKKWLAFSLGMCGVYLKDGQLTFYHQFLGQGTDVNVLDKTYDKCVDLTGVIRDFCADKTTREQTVDSVYAACQSIAQ